MASTGVTGGSSTQRLEKSSFSSFVDMLLLADKQIWLLALLSDGH